MDFTSAIEFKEAAYAVAFLIFVLERLYSYYKTRLKKLTGGARGLEKNWLLNEELYPILYDIVIEYNAIRAFIVQFHNGEHFYSGQSIQKMTCSHEVKRPGYKGVKSSYIAVPVDDEVHRIIADIRKDEYYTIEDIEKEEDIDLRERLGFLKVKSKYCYGIHDSQGRIVGVLYLHFNHLSAINSEQVQGLRMTVSQLSNLLSKHND